MKDEYEWKKASEAARKLAEKNTWDHVVKRWETMLGDLVAKVGSGRT